MQVFPEYVTRNKYPATSDYIEMLYLDYFNNYLTVEKFASDYGMPIEDAIEVIETGRQINNL